MLIGASIIKWFADQVRIRLISHLINGISRVLQTLFKYFNCTIILTYFVQSFPILPAIFVLSLNETLLLLSAGKLAVATLSSENGLPL